MAPRLRGGARYRSILYVPASRPDRIEKARRSGADAVLIDLEDSVAPTAKAVARQTARAVLDDTVAHPDPAIFVRVNPWGSGLLAADVRAVLAPGLCGIFLPKVSEPAEITALDLLLGELEREAGLRAGSVEISPICETAAGMHGHFGICGASTRIRRTGMVGFAIGGDNTAAVGVLPSSPEFSEMLPFNVRSGLEARAVGIEHVLGGMTGVVGDLDLVRRMAERARAYGANGSTIIHPSHVSIVNEVFTPSSEEVERARATIISLASAVSEAGAAAARLDDAMIDYAHGRAAVDLLASARRFGVPVAPVPDLAIPE